MPNSDHRSKVTIEDLLRLKRAERPSAEFWSTFERELRQKQLSALLDKRPWWQDLPQFFARRAYLPIGATAILAFTLVSVKHYTPQIVQVEAASVGSSVALNRQSEIPAEHPVSVPVSSPLVNRNDQAASRLDDRTNVLASNQSLPAEPAALAPAVAAPRSSETPSARFIAANLANLEQSEPELVNAVMGSRLSSPARVQTVSASLVELASVPTSASKRSRLLAQYNDRPLSPEPTAPDIVRERLARRLGDNEMTDRISRIGLKGDQVSLGLTLRL
jgi:hypothetical protein